MEWSRPWLARGVLACVVISLLVPTGVSAVTHEKTGLGPGTVTEPANETTYVGVQGFHFKGVGNPKKPARLVAADGDANGRVITGGEKHDANWFYDVDPLENGNLLVTSTNPDGTVVFELDPETNEAVWTERFPDLHDTHDADLINGDQLLIANMRNNDDGVSNDRVLVYDRSNDTVVWEWVFRNHYPNSTDGGFSSDWTHVNDVDKVADGEYLVSPRNFDQVILLNRSTDSIDYRLGSDDGRGTLFEQHNPDWLRSEDGAPTILVADSENDRVVEYERRDGEWTRTWTITGFNWPRDADRLENGNTLVTDSLNHRVVEIAPNGTVVWEFYASWGPYDAERGPAGSNGPTMADMNTTGSYRVSGGAGIGPASQETFSDWLNASAANTAFEGPASEFSARYKHVTPFLRPVWMSSWALAALFLAVLVTLGWGLAEVVYNRQRIARGLVATVERVKSASRGT
jgi:hypothetical protein